MLDSAQQVLRWRVRPLVNHVLDESRELLGEEIQLISKLVERDVHACTHAARTYAVATALIMLAVIAGVGGIAALLVRVFPTLSIDEALLGIAVLCLGGGYFMEKRARAELKRSFRSPKEIVDEIAGR